MNLSVLDRTRQILRRKHYSWNTEKVYCQWIERYDRSCPQAPRREETRTLSDSSCTRKSENAVLATSAAVLEKGRSSGFLFREPQLERALPANPAVLRGLLPALVRGNTQTGDERLLPMNAGECYRGHAHQSW